MLLYVPGNKGKSTKSVNKAARRTKYGSKFKDASRMNQSHDTVSTNKSNFEDSGQKTKLENQRYS